MLSLLHQKVIHNFQPFFLIVIHTLPIISFGIPEHSCRRYRRGGRLRDCLSNISDSPGILLAQSLPSDMYLTSVLSYQIQHLPSKKARTTASPAQVTQLSSRSNSSLHLILISLSSKHQVLCKSHQSSHKMPFLTLASQRYFLHPPLHHSLMKSLRYK